MHDTLDIALGLILSACGWLIVRLVGRVDANEDKINEHSEEIRDTRSAIARIEGAVGLDPYPYTH